MRAGSGVGQEVGPPWVVGDIVGCGIKFEEMKHDGLGRTRVQVFFTRNGRKVSKWSYTGGRNSLMLVLVSLIS